jgi:hypothetical protein
MAASDMRASDSSRCEATNKAGQRCGKRAARGRFCLTHAGVQNMRELGRKGGRARTRPGMGGKQLPASLRERLRASIDEDRLAEVLVAGLESENAKERLDVAKLVLAELAAGPKTQGWVCTCYSAPGQFCQQLEPHGYRSVPKTVSLEDLVAVASECRMLSGAGSLDPDVERDMLVRLKARPA